MESDFVIPTSGAVESACTQFDSENGVVEDALRKLFALFPSNEHLDEVLLKVVTLNSLYSTQIRLFSTLTPTLQEVAEQIWGQYSVIDAELASGSTEVVERIGLSTSQEKKRHYNFSFATKYCSWHRQNLYPIWDSRVDLYLRRLHKQSGFSGIFKRSSELWTYEEFRKVVDTVRDQCGLSDFSYKQLDKFFYVQGTKLINEATATAESSAG